MLDAIKKSAGLSFLLDGKPYTDLSPKVTVTEDVNTVVTVYEFKGGLRLTNTKRIYPEYGAADYVNEWENIGEEPSGIISELWDADITVPFPKSIKKETGPAYLPSSENVVKIYAPRGSDWSANEFFCDVDNLTGNRYANWLREGEVRRYATTGGRSADSVKAPFFNIKHGCEPLGLIAAIGWTGQWNAQISRAEESVTFRSKIEDTDFKILPGEKFRTASVTLMPYSGSATDGQNKWRRFVREVYSPIGKGGVPEYAPFCAGLWGGMSSEGCVERIKKVESEKLPFDHYWMDAGWYGFGKDKSPDEYEGDWADHTGNWEINAVRHPDKMRDVVDEIAKGDKRFLLWFEPERVRVHVPIAKEHPEYLIFLGEGEKNALLNLGREDAWQYCFDTLCEFIEKLKISVYRQDFNFRPLPYWRKADAEDRRGITEIKHINGLYRLWDSLIERYPYLLIDNCASGGRRIDIETLRRSVPLWRSDAQCPADPIPEITQAHALSHSAWMPYSGTGTGRIWYDTYRFRSAYSPALTTNYTFSERNTFGDDKDAIEWLRKMSLEYLRVRPYLSEDVYPLTKPSAATDIWSGVQYHDPKSDSGVIQLFRREASPYTEATFKLSSISADKTYIFEDSDGGKLTLSGDTLINEGFRAKITEMRAAKVYFYNAV